MRVPILVGDALHTRVRYEERHFHLADLGVIPRSVVTGAWKSRDLLLWTALQWGLSPEEFEVLDHMPMSAVRELVEQWEEASEITLDEVVGVIKTARDHKSALESDLIDRGLRLRNFPTPEYTWHDLHVIITNSNVHSRLFAACHPEQAGWDLPAQLAAEAVDLLRWIQWSKSQSAQDDPENPPKPIPRPGVGTKEPKHRKMTLEQAKALFDRPDPDREKKLYAMFRD